MADQKLWEKAHLLPRYYGVTWDKDIESQAYDKVQEYIENLAENLKNGTGLTILGQPGRGKTLLAHMVADAALDMQVPCRLVTVVGFQQLLMAQMDLMRLIEHKAGDVDKAADRWWANKAEINRILKRYKLLIVDDVGKEHTGIHTSGYFEGQLDRIVRARGARKLATVITTNVKTAEFSESYGASMASYLVEVNQLISCDDMDDYRAVIGRARRRHR